MKVIIAATTTTKTTTTIRKQTIKLHIVTVVLEFIVSVTRPGGWLVGGLKDPDATCEESASLTDALAGMWGNTRWVITYREHWSQVRTGPQATHDQKWSCLQLSDLHYGNSQVMIKAVQNANIIPLFVFCLHMQFDYIVSLFQNIWQLWILTPVCWCCIWSEHNFCAFLHHAISMSNFQQTVFILHSFWMLHFCAFSHFYAS